MSKRSAYFHDGLVCLGVRPEASPVEALLEGGGHKRDGLVFHGQRGRTGKGGCKEWVVCVLWHGVSFVWIEIS